MALYKFAWSAWVTDALVDRLAGLAAVAPAEVEAQRARIAGILAAVGGLPITGHVPSIAERTARAADLLHEAARHVLASIVPAAPRSVVLASGPSPFAEVDAFVTVGEPVDLNRADASAVAALPAIGPALARRIVEERLRRGPFASLDELDRRVDGIGPVITRRIAPLVTLDDPADLLRPRWHAGSFDTDVARLLALHPAPTPAARLAGVLEILAMACARSPHPSTSHAVRRDAPLALGALTAADWVAALAGEAYFERLPALFARARHTIDVCMFHIALPSEQHPTRQLLEALGAARDRGVAVRVLVDRDRDGDPYHSTVINSAAVRFLTGRGVDCRSDAADRLLHSKFVIVDGDLAIVGSHNWSAGSYFEFDDVSLLVSSAAFNADLRRRFDALWPAA